VNVEGGRTDLTAGNSDGDCQNGSTLVNLDDAGTPPDQATMPMVSTLRRACDHLDAP
jgi:hypothetical protein